MVRTQGTHKSRVTHEGQAQVTRDTQIPAGAVPPVAHPLRPRRLRAHADLPPGVAPGRAHRPRVLGRGPLPPAEEGPQDKHRGRQNTAQPHDGPYAGGHWGGGRGGCRGRAVPRGRGVGAGERRGEGGGGGRAGERGHAAAGVGDDRAGGGVEGRGAGGGGGGGAEEGPEGHARGQSQARGPEEGGPGGGLLHSGGTRGVHDDHLRNAPKDRVPYTPLVITPPMW